MRSMHRRNATCEARPSPPRLPSPKHRPSLKTERFQRGRYVRNRREPRPGRPCEAPPTQAACLRGVRGPARRMESSPAPGSLWFLSPAGKELVRPQTHETLTSSILNPACMPPSPYPTPPTPQPPENNRRNPRQRRKPKQYPACRRCPQKKIIRPKYLIHHARRTCQQHQKRRRSQRSSGLRPPPKPQQ